MRIAKIFTTYEKNYNNIEHLYQCYTHLHKEDNRKNKQEVIISSDINM